MRNRIYDHSFDDKHGLSPPGIAQANKQAREESLKMFYAATNTIEIPVSTPAQVTRFLKWLSDSKHRPLRTAESLEFSYLDAYTGATTIRFNRQEVLPADMATAIALKEQQAGSSLQLTTTLPSGVTVPSPQLALKVWHYCLGLPKIDQMTYCRSYTTHLRALSMNFTAAIHNNSPWTSYQITVLVEEPQQYFCSCVKPYKFFMSLVKRLDGAEIGDTHLREIAFYLFRLSLKAEKQSKARKEKTPG